QLSRPRLRISQLGSRLRLGRIETVQTIRQFLHSILDIIDFLLQFGLSLLCSFDLVVSFLLLPFQRFFQFLSFLLRFYQLSNQILPYNLDFFHTLLHHIHLARSCNCEISRRRSVSSPSDALKRCIALPKRRPDR
ncbi:hypothetical protein PENTCL1PPCAC_8138, partial [Pristionchus entomophagus]